ncbi:MAG: response regulator [Pyrinomonadaceae bacterium]
MEAAPLFEKVSREALIGKFHNGFANVLVHLGRTENRSNYIDRALIEYAAASYHFEQAGHARYHACVENNLGFLFSTLGKYGEAHEHLDRAQALFTSLKDSVHLAQVDETRARVMLAEGRADAAEKLVRSAVQTLERGGEQSLLAEALTTHGRALARLGRHQLARLTLQHAVEVAQGAGDVEGAGQAALAVIEELGEQLTPRDLGVTFDRAAELLSATRHPGSKDRLVNCARRVLFLLGVMPVPDTWANFSFKDAVHRYEACLIERALTDACGTTARAAQLLGIKRQSLDSMLHTRHQGLLPLRTPGEARKSSLMFRDSCDARTRPVTILYVEDDSLVADAIKEMLEAEGWTVETCGDGAEALSKIEGTSDYDLLIYDHGLPNVTGLELIRRGRSLAHRQQTPVIMLSSSDVEREARRAGANVYLRKPEDALSLAEHAARLLARKLKQN